MTVPKVAVLDIETAPIVGNVWGLFDQNVGLNQIVRDWVILSVSWKWMHEKKVHYVDNRGAPMDDAATVKTIWQVLDEADFVVGHNVIKFDVRKINARLIHYKLPPPSPYKMLDTQRMAKKVMMATSNKLEYLSAAFTDQPKSLHKAFPGFELWAAVLRDEPKAWEAMKKYNAQDVRATEKLYLVLRPWCNTHPNVNVYDDGTKVRCPKCGSDHIQRRGTMTTNTGKYTRFHCTDCGGWSRTRYTENSVQKRRSLLASV